MFLKVNALKMNNAQISYRFISDIHLIDYSDIPYTFEGLGISAPPCPIKYYPKFEKIQLLYKDRNNNCEGWKRRVEVGRRCGGEKWGGQW